MKDTIGIISQFLLLALLAFFLWWLLKTWRKKKNFGKSNDNNIEEPVFGETRAQKKQRLSDLKMRYQCIEDMFIWFNARLMENRKEHDIKAELISEWCCEDKSGKADLPMRSRPAALSFRAGGKTQTYDIDWEHEEQFLTLSDTKLVAWGLLQQCSTLIPFRFYRMEIHRSIRTFSVKNDVPVAWQDDTATLENYSINIS